MHGCVGFDLSQGTSAKAQWMLMVLVVEFCLCQTFTGAGS